MDAQNAQIWTASVVIGIEPKSAPNGGSASCYPRRLRVVGRLAAPVVGPLHEEHPDLLPAWYAFRDARARRRAVQWLAGNSLIDDEAADQFLAGHPDPDLP